MSAVRGTFHNFKSVPTRKAFQIIIEFAEEETANVFNVLGIPNSSSSIWVGVARLQEPQPEEAICD